MSAPAQATTLLAAIAMTAGMATLVWLALAAVARVAPRASLTMAAANAAAAVSLTLVALRGTLPDALTHWPADVLTVAAFALLGVAVPALLTSRPPWRRAAIAVGAASLALLVLPDDGTPRWRTGVASGMAAGLVLVAAVTARRHLSDSDGRRTPAVLALPLFLIALLMALRGADSGLRPDDVPGEFDVAFLWAALVLALVQNATLAFLVLMRLIRRIERLLERDPLTDTLNRGAFDRALAQAHAWFRRGRGYALVMIDMDRFKQLNDSLGHAAGDTALRLMVHELQPCVREVDRFGRLGGEEFCVLLPDTDLAGAALVAERMRMLVEMAPLRWLEQDWPLSASFGIAEAERDDATGDAVLARADAALYRAKHQGRNVVQA